MTTVAGVCGCGCGETTPIASRTQTSKGWVKGQPVRFKKNHNKRQPLNKRFWQHVNKQGSIPSAEAVRVWPEIEGTRCWEWTASTNAKGYGSVGMENGGDPQLAHRVAWWLATGRWPEPCGLHKCDNTKCVRFSHLFEGTNKNNADDRETKGRGNQPRGTQHGNAVLTSVEVKHIRAAYYEGKSIENLAKEHDVSHDTMYRVVTNRTYRDELYTPPTMQCGRPKGTMEVTV